MASRQSKILDALRRCVSMIDRIEVVARQSYDLLDQDTCAKINGITDDLVKVKHTLKVDAEAEAWANFCKRMYLDLFEYKSLNVDDVAEVMLNRYLDSPSEYRRRIKQLNDLLNQ